MLSGPPHGIPHEGCGGTFVLSRAAIHDGLWGHLKCDKCGALADTTQMGIPARDFPHWDHDIPSRAKKSRYMHHGPHYVGCGCGGHTIVGGGRTPRKPSQTANSYGARSRPRGPLILGLGIMAATVLCVVWFAGMYGADVTHAIQDGVGDAAEHADAILGDAANAASGVVDAAHDMAGSVDASDMAAGGATVLSGLGDAAHNMADILESGQADKQAAGSVVESDVESAREYVTGDAVGQPDEPDTIPAPSPLDRTIYPDGTTHGTPPQPELTETEQIESIIYELTNKHREAAGLHTLERIPQIDQIARSHSQDMADRDYYAHDTPEGLDPTDRANAAKYPCRKDYGSHYTYGLAENIHMLDNVRLQKPARIAELLMDGGGYMVWNPERMHHIVTGWMDSPGHRQNILHADYTRIGIGVAFNGMGDIYATQNFC